jgi:tetratricopeptide (TPR) repeat protein
MADSLATQDRLAAFLPRLTELMRRSRVLIVIDGLQALLTDDGYWRDDRWGQVVWALIAHAGLGRVIMTSRRLPVTSLAGLRVEPVAALPQDETLLLTRELPHLRALGHGTVPGIDRATSRLLARRVYEVAQCHPKLLELADGQAARPERLAALVNACDQAWRRPGGGLPHGFFADDGGQTAAPGEDYLQVLADWTTSVAGMMVPSGRFLFWLLCFLEEGDRTQPVLDGTWASLWRWLGQETGHPEVGGAPPPGLDEVLAAAAVHGLVSVGARSYSVQPGVAEAGRGRVGQSLQGAVDAAAADYWAGVHGRAAVASGDRPADTGLMVRAGLAAVPYLLRLGQWRRAATLLESAFNQDPSRANAVAVLPAIRQVASHDPRQAIVVARVLAVLDPAVGEAQMRSAMADADGRGDYPAAAVASGWLVNLCWNAGRLDEALTMAGRQAEYTRKVGRGPWTLLFTEVQRLQVLGAMGRSREVLDEAGRLREHMATLPAVPGPNETISPPVVRELLLDTGRNAAVRLELHAEALALSAEVTASLRDRNAPATTIARVRYSDFAPLLRLGRVEEALAVLIECRQVFEDARDTVMLGKTLLALADAEHERGHGDAALHLVRDALRYSSLAGDTDGIAVGYHNLGRYLRAHARQPGQAAVSHLAAALIHALAADGLADDSAKEAVADLRESGAVTLPADVASLCRELAGIAGTNVSGPAPAGLLTTLAPDPDAAARALHEIIAGIQENV